MRKNNAAHPPAAATRPSFVLPVVFNPWLPRVLLYQRILLFVGKGFVTPLPTEHPYALPFSSPLPPLSLSLSSSVYTVSLSPCFSTHRIQWFSDLRLLFPYFLRLHSIISHNSRTARRFSTRWIGGWARLGNCRYVAWAWNLCSCILYEISPQFIDVKKY